MGTETARKEPKRRDNPSEERNASRILIVDDEKNLRQVLAEVLSDEGYKTVEVATGKEAIDCFKRLSFEVVITDLRMPDISGIDILKGIRKIDPEACIIMLTGYSSVESAVAAMKEGAYDYIAKPFNIDELKLIVKKAMERSHLYRQAKEKEYYRTLSITDGLTNIYNHRYFHETLEREIKRARRYPQPITLMLMDIDDFKIYNDNWGHLAGDHILSDIGRLMAENVRETNIVARYGGEEFAIIMPETDKDEGSALAGRVAALIERTKFDKATVFPANRLTVSIGLASYPENALSKNELIQRADEALYEAKRKGKNRICQYSRKNGNNGKTESRHGNRE